MSFPLNVDWSGVLLCTVEHSGSDGVLVLPLDLKIPFSLPRSYSPPILFQQAQASLLKDARLIT